MNVILVSLLGLQVLGKGKLELVETIPLLSYESCAVSREHQVMYVSSDKALTKWQLSPRPTKSALVPRGAVYTLAGIDSEGRPVFERHPDRLIRLDGNKESAFNERAYQSLKILGKTIIQEVTAQRQSLIRRKVSVNADDNDILVISIPVEGGVRSGSVAIYDAKDSKFDFSVAYCTEKTNKYSLTLLRYLKNELYEQRQIRLPDEFMNSWNFPDYLWHLQRLRATWMTETKLLLGWMTDTNTELFYSFDLIQGRFDKVGEVSVSKGEDLYLSTLHSLGPDRFCFRYKGNRIGIFKIISGASN